MDKIERRMKIRHVHFVGFRGADFISAVKVFGKPDFVHITHDHRMYGDIDLDHDLVIFGSKAKADVIRPLSDPDHKRH
jgi:hypothetical protein